MALRSSMEAKVWCIFLFFTHRGGKLQWFVLAHVLNLTDGQETFCILADRVTFYRPLATAEITSQQ